jgi:hypothetical protein
MGRFQVIGNRDTIFETLLWDSDSLTEAKRWLDGYVEDNGGGYANIEVVDYDDDVPYVHYSWTSDVDS